MKRTRNNQFAIRLSDSEIALFNKKQAASGLSKTDFFVRLLNNSKIKIYCFNEALKILYNELRRIGVNLKDKDPILAQSDEAQPDGQPVMYDGGGDDFTAIQNETAFDYKKLGAQMLTDGFDLDATLEELDKKWTEARGKLGIE